MLEERFLTKGTVIVTKDDVLLQAVQVRGSGRAREVWFAPSSLSRTVAAAGKIRASVVYSSEAVTHVFMNVLGAVFAPRLAPGDPPSAMSFKAVSLQASPQAAELETVSLRAIIGGSMVGDAWMSKWSCFLSSACQGVHLWWSYKARREAQALPFRG